MKFNFNLLIICTSSAFTTTFGGNTNYFEQFNTLSWIQSNNDRYKGSVVEISSENAPIEGDQGLRISQSHKHYGISTKLDSPVSVGDKNGFVVQYEVKYTAGVHCSGSYLKLLIEDPNFESEKLEESTPYSIMFGPDICGGTNKVHLIFRQENPISGKFEEKHMATNVQAIKDDKTHLYTLVVTPDNKFIIKIDGEVKNSGELVSDSDFTPAFQVPKEIDDKDDSQPEDWVTEPMMPDPEDIKPEGWDDIPAEIPDPDAKQPEDWDEDDDGEWEAPSLPNPEYKGPWKQKEIKNPEYKGEWAPRKIPNPDYFKDENPVANLKPIGAIAIEILANDKGIHFDSIMIGNDVTEADRYVSTTFSQKKKLESEKAAQEKSSINESERENAYKEGGYPQLAKVYFSQALDMARTSSKEKPWVTLAIVVSTLTFLLIVCCKPFSSGDTIGDDAAHKKDDAAAAHKKDDDKGKESNDEKDEEDDDDSTEDE